MKLVLEDKLLKEFPNLYRQYNLSPQETCMCWGFSCGDGWFEIIYELSKKISELDPEVQAVQVKEKFGGLRFYTYGGSGEHWEEIENFIREAEEESYKTCEWCGEKNNVNQTEGWIVTLCDSCMKKRQEGFNRNTQSSKKRIEEIGLNEYIKEQIEQLPERFKKHFNLEDYKNATKSES